MRFFRAPLIAKLLFPSGIWKGKESDSIYLTFDDGPNPEVTPWVLDLLNEFQIKATFFLVGKNVKDYPELLKRIISEGHQIGNHTMNHECGTKTGINTYISSVSQAEIYIQSDLFRPPYGKITRNQFKKLLDGGKKIVFWSWLSYDFDKNISPKKIIQKAKDIKGGDILVFHDSEKGFPNLKNSIIEIIEQLKSRGLKFKTL
ncbi:MAG: polysaccharide deacetylase family protein [Crocinitomicaceae bacterium]|jgi:peptidoglycan/xylan/chitin deacetylase (PgdA/CDA1 family)